MSVKLGGSEEGGARIGDGSLVWFPSSATQLLYQIPSHIAESLGNGLVKLAWVPAVVKGFDMADGSNRLVLCEVEWDSNVTIKVPFEDVLLRSDRENIEENVFNFAKLQCPNDASVLTTLQYRYNHHKLLTGTIGSTLLLVNPVATALTEYVSVNDSVDTYVNNLLSNINIEKKDSVVILRGCSGSGKSETGKRLLELLFSKASTSPHNMKNYNTVLDVVAPIGSAENPFYIPPDLYKFGRPLAAALRIFDAMASSQTDKHHNSTRHVKAVKIIYDRGMSVIGAHAELVHFDSSRFGTKDNLLKPYNLYAILIAGLMDSRNSEFKFLPNQRDAIFLNMAKPFSYYSKEFDYLKELLVTATKCLDEESWETILRLLAACMHFQSLTIVGTDAAILSQTTKNHVGAAESLLGAETFSTTNLIIKKKDEKMGKIVSVDQRPLEAKSVIDCVTNEIYSSIMKYILHMCNSKMGVVNPLEGMTPLGVTVLDVPGWETLELVNNGMAQFEANYYDERLLHHFVTHRFTNEIKKYNDENIVLSDIAYPESSCYLDLLEKPPTSLIYLLEEACNFIRGDDKSFLEKAVTVHAKGNNKLFRNAGHKHKMTCFIIRHTFGDVMYDAEGFVLLNKQKLTIQAAAYIEALNIPLLKEALKMFGSITASESAADSASADPDDPNKLTPGLLKARREQASSQYQSKGNYYLTKAKDSLLRTINAYDDTTTTTVSHIVCVKHNADPSNQLFNPIYVNEQIKHLGLSNLAQLCKSGFTVNVRYVDFYIRFRPIFSINHPKLPVALPASALGVERRRGSVSPAPPPTHELISLCKILLEECLSVACLPKTNEVLGGSALGINFLFFKDWLYSELDNTRANTLVQMQLSAISLQSLIRMYKFRKVFVIKKAAAVAIQKSCRMHCNYVAFNVQRHASTKIKSNWRAYKDRIWYNRLRRVVILVKSRLWRNMIFRIRYKRIQRTSRAFQGICKGFVVRNRVNRIINHIYILQRYMKKFLVRNRLFYAYQAAALKVQAVTRGFQYREKNASNLYYLDMKRNQRAHSRAICVMQFCWRAFCYRKRKKIILNATVRLQRWFKFFNQHKWYRCVRYLVRWIQSHVRRIKGVKQVHEIRALMMLQQENMKLNSIVQRELDHINESYGALSELVLSSDSIQYGDKATRSDKGFSRYLLGFDVNADISEVYSEGYIVTLLNFQKILSKKKKCIKKIVIGSYHTIILDDTNGVYSFGLGDCGQLGLMNRKNYSTPQLVDTMVSLLEKEERYIISNSHSINSSTRVTVADIACGKDHVLLLTNFGRVYAWGSNRQGQLGVPSNTIGSDGCTAIPRLIDIAILKNVKAISAGSFHSVCITDACKLYTWGQYDCCGNNDAPVGVPLYQPTPVPFFKGLKVQKIVCGDMYTIVLSARDLYSWGHNNCGQLGCGNFAHQLSPVSVLIPQSVSDSKMIKLKAELYGGKKHCAFIINSHMWMWGSNKHGQIGNGTKENVCIPHYISVPCTAETATSTSSSKNSIVGNIKSCTLTWKGTYACTTSGALWMWGYQTFLPQYHHVVGDTEDKIYTVPTEITLEMLSFHTYFTSGSVITGIQSYGSSGANTVSMLSLEVISGATIAASTLNSSTTLNASIDKTVTTAGGSKSTPSKSTPSKSTPKFDISPRRPSVLDMSEAKRNISTTNQFMSNVKQQIGSGLRLSSSAVLTEASIEEKNDAVHGSKESTPDKKRKKNKGKSMYDRSKEGDVTDDGLLILMSPMTTIIQNRNPSFKQQVKKEYNSASCGVGMPLSDKEILKSGRGSASNTDLLTLRMGVSRRLSSTPFLSNAVKNTEKMAKELSVNAGVIDINKISEQQLKRDNEKYNRGIPSTSAAASVASSDVSSPVKRRTSAPTVTKAIKNAIFESTDDASVSQMTDLATMISALKVDKLKQINKRSSYTY